MTFTQIKKSHRGRKSALGVRAASHAGGKVSIVYFGEDVTEILGISKATKVNLFFGSDEDAGKARVEPVIAGSATDAYTLHRHNIKSKAFKITCRKLNQRGEAGVIRSTPLEYTVDEKGVTFTLPPQWLPVQDAAE